MSYEHGINIKENATSLEQPVESLSAVQVVFGTAPINLINNPSAAVNEPIIVRTFDEAKEKLGYSDNWDSFTLCQSMDACFKQLKVAPIIFVNVLDPAIHKESVAALSVNLVAKKVTIGQEGILLSSLIVKNSTGTTTFVKNTDYLAAFNGAGHVVISVIPTGAIPVESTTLQVTFDKLDPSAVTTVDVIGGYDAASDTFTGIEAVDTVYPKLSIYPGLLLAPGFSHEPEVGAVLVAKNRKINGCFNAQSVIDLNGLTKEAALQNKEDAGYTDSSAIPCWPKAKIGNKVYYYSAIVAATMARTDALNSGVPFKSPSNKLIPVSAMVNEEGKEVFLDQPNANVLNAKGIMTAINMGGWRTWGNGTANFDADVAGPQDPKERFIAVRRMFDWWGNTFILAYFRKVDDPSNVRLIESLVDDENIRANSFQAQNQIAGGRIEFRKTDNPISQIMEGKIVFNQKLGFYTPAELIENTLEFDPTILSASFGGE